MDEADGFVYCLSSSKDSSSVSDTHFEAHGLLPNHTYEVTEGMAAAIQGKKIYSLIFTIWALVKLMPQQWKMPIKKTLLSRISMV